MQKNYFLPCVKEWESTVKAKEFIPASKPRNFVAKNQQTAGAGAHRDKKKEQKQGYEKHKGKGVSEGWGQKEFEVDGYTYMTDLDVEEDNRKIWHMIKTPDGKTVNVDFTPYQYMSKDDVELYIKLGMPKRQGPGPLDSEKLQKMAQIKGVAMLDPRMANAGKERNSMEGSRDPEDWDEGNTEPPNNFAVYINGKKWKVFKGRGQFADDYKEIQHYRQLRTWAEKKSAETGKKWTVSVTGEPATE
jgi:hypothetical protein